MPARVCLHCRDPSRSVNRPRGLCWRCFYAPGVRECYPVSASPHAHRGVGLSGKRRPQPTAALPGTEEKVLALIGRAERGEHLWHECDGRPLLSDAAYLTPAALNPQARRVTHYRPRAVVT